MYFSFHFQYHFVSSIFIYKSVLNVFPTLSTSLWLILFLPLTHLVFFSSFCYNFSSFHFPFSLDSSIVNIETQKYCMKMSLSCWKCTRIFFSVNEIMNLWKFQDFFWISKTFPMWNKQKISYTWASMWRINENSYI